MAIRVAINGYGRIGRNVLRACYESRRDEEIKIVAINDLGDVEINEHLTRYDSTHGKFVGEVTVQEGNLVIDGDVIQWRKSLDLVILNNLEFLDAMLLQWDCEKEERKSILQEAYDFQYPILKRSKTIKRMQELADRMERG